MISYESDGATLVDSAGNKSTPMDGAKYSGMLSTRDLQLSAASANTQAVANYNNALAGAQTSVNAGRPATAPPKPLQTIVSDAGVTSYAAFSPPLADLVPLEITAPSMGTTPVAVTVDTQAIMFAMIQAIYRKMFPGG